MELVFAGLLRLISLEEHNSTAFVAGRQVVSGLIELDGGYYVGLGDVFNVTLVTEASAIIGSVLYHELMLPCQRKEKSSRRAKAVLRHEPRFAILNRLNLLSRRPVWIRNEYHVAKGLQRSDGIPS